MFSLFLSFLSQESCFGTVEYIEHTKDIYFTYKRCEWISLRKIKQHVSLNIVININQYVIYNANYVCKQLNV